MLIPKDDQLLQTLHADHLGPMTTTNKKYQYIFAIIDGLTKFCWLFPTKTTGTKEVLEKYTQGDFQQSYEIKPMRRKSDLKILQLLDEDMRETFSLNRQNIREDAKLQILALQNENMNTYNKKARAVALCSYTTFFFTTL